MKILLPLLPPTQAKVIFALMAGELAIEPLAETLGITVGGARLHVATLERHGIIGFRRVKFGPGRPRHLYALTAAFSAALDGREI